MVHIFLFSLWLLLPTTLLADGAPSPYDQNHSGAYGAATVSFGQSRAVGASSPGVAAFLAAEAGFVSARQSWNRLEMSVEAGMGRSSYSLSGGVQVDLDVDLYMLAKIGYGYSIGNNTFGVMRIGAGPAMATYPASALANSGSSKSISGFMGLFGYDVVFPASEGVELVGGIENRITNFTGDGVSSFQVNIPGIRLAIRSRF